MKQFTLIATLIICLLNSAYGQNKTYLGFEFSVANDLYEITDTGDYLVAIPLVDGQGGLTLRQELNRNIFIETGLIIKYYWEGFGFKTIPYYGGSGSDEASVIIPVRFGLNLNLYKEKIYLVPVVGYSFGINPTHGYGVSYGTPTSSTTTINYYSTENPDVSRYFSLLQTGIGFEFATKALLFSISTNYYHGFNKTAQWDFTYTVNNSDPMTGSTISKGEFWGVGLEIRYPISNFWAMK